MRNSFINSLEQLAATDSRVVLLTADLGFSVLEGFASRFPKRFFNVGVCEQNMIGMAAGLASDGFLPFVYSIAPFTTLRPIEFIRNCVVAQQLPVRIAGVGAGMAYGNNGISHYAIEDIAVMRALPGMDVYAPADGPHACAVLEATWASKAPVYYRLGKDDKVRMAGLVPTFSPGRLDVIEEGRDILLVGNGGMGLVCDGVARGLRANGYSCGIAWAGSLEPFPVTDMAAQLQNTATVATIEDHVMTGGLGTIIAELMADGQLPARRLLRFGIKDMPTGRTGSEADMLDRCGLAPHGIMARLEDVLSKSGKRVMVGTSEGALP